MHRHAPSRPSGRPDRAQDKPCGRARAGRSGRPRIRPCPRSSALRPDTGRRPPRPRPKPRARGHRHDHEERRPRQPQWLAHHRAIGVDDILVHTNDCTDGTDRLLARLDSKGLVQHRTNPYRATGLKPQHAALQAAEDEPAIREAGWVVCMDVDGFITITTGDGTLAALFTVTRGANPISMTWRLFGNADIDGYEDRPVMAQFTLCATKMTRKPHQTRGVKTLFRNKGLFRKLGVHRPRGLEPGRLNEIRWVDGSGRPLPPRMHRTACRSPPPERRATIWCRCTISPCARPRAFWSSATAAGSTMSTATRGLATGSG
ncbi:glycosyltransferase family 2 protein [Rhodovulum visakhapatnamense]|uniref:Glycosyltransferase family 2 protein n=1 Tax=Rhodovulum visakhapatnamense TaxID=364297 RepID=A0ABS1RF56_9RHOB|nr:glycosyltransferase family 2 protein [Rhodovulum visakhapatnamense]MBL3578290.1 glycosyltransferase family 2 protein [Rhodovulum visakhapatnamense]